jgi:hypothetical protein
VVTYNATHLVFPCGGWVKMACCSIECWRESLKMASISEISFRIGLCARSGKRPLQRTLALAS